MRHRLSMTRKPHRPSQSITSFSTARCRHSATGPTAPCRSRNEQQFGLRAGGLTPPGSPNFYLLFRTRPGQLGSHHFPTHNPDQPKTNNFSMARPASVSHTTCGSHRRAVAEAPWDRSSFARLGESLFMTSPVAVAWYSLFSAGVIPQSWEPLMWLAVPVLIILGVILLCELMGMRYIPNNRVGIIEKLW